jgi:GNAT superfamily N-acetyltransferase
MSGVSGSALSIRDAVAADLPAIAALALRSKGHWGYDSALLDAMRDELSWDAEDLARMRFRIGETTDLVGFSAVARQYGTRVELEALFVEPAYIGTGAGRLLMADAVDVARDLGARILEIQSDPFAERFYLAAGARRVGERPSASIPGRVLPLLELDLSP